MRPLLLWLLLITVTTASACSGEKRYPLKGQVLAVDAAQQVLTVKHEDVVGFMPAMTMPFKVRKGSEIAASKPGDLITATLAVSESVGYLEDIVKVGEAPLPEGPTPLVMRMIEPGTAVPDAEFTDQDGRKRRFSDWRGQTTAVTFVYTRCPLPDFCPLMDRNFLAIQRVLEEDPALAARVRLLSVSFDPDYDTPEVLRAHAQRIGVNPQHWSYVTGPRETVDGFAGVFGVSVMRDDKPMQEIVHNLRTAVIDAKGRLSSVLNGNSWKPEQLVEAIRAADAKR